MSFRHLSLIAAAMTLTSALATAQDSDARSTRPRTQRTERSRVTGESETTSKKANTQSDQNLSEQLGWEVAATDDGMRIERIMKNSPIARAHLQERDIIVSVGGENVETTDRLNTILHDLSGAEEQQAEIVVLRDGEELSYMLPLETIAADEQKTGTRTTAMTSDRDLVEMVQQLQMQNERQHELLQTVLLELQTLRSQIAGAPNANGAAAGTQIRSNSVTAPGRPPTNSGTNRPAAGAVQP